MLGMLKNGMACLAAAGLVLASPAAAATRSADSLPKAGAVVMGKQARLASRVGTSDDLTAVPVFGWVLGALVVIGFIWIVADDNKKSPG